MSNTYKPTDEDRKMVTQFAAVGMTIDQICMLITNPETGKGLSPKTLRKFFREELDKGGLKANYKVSSNMFKMATGDGKHAFNAGKYWLNCRAPTEWNERVIPEKLELSGKVGGPVIVEIVKFSDDPD
jgi:hypothetical protein